MPRLLAVGHVTWDRREDGDVLGGSVTYGTLTARKLGWETAILTSAGPDFAPDRDLPGVRVFRHPSSATTRFTNLYDVDGTRRQYVTARDRKSTRLNSSHTVISYAVFCLKKKKKQCSNNASRPQLY